MGRKESSFHIGGEFNGYGSARYLKGIYPSMNPPVSQENVHLSPDFRQYLLKLLGTMPLVISPSAMNPILKAISGTLACVNEVIITQDKKSGKYCFQFQPGNIQELTDGSYPFHYQGVKPGKTVVVSLGEYDYSGFILK